MKRYLLSFAFFAAFTVPTQSRAVVNALCGCYNAATGQQLALGYATARIPLPLGAARNAINAETFVAVRNATTFYNNWVINNRLACRIITSQLDQLNYCVYVWHTN